MDYRLLISIEAVEFVERLPNRTRQRIRKAIHSIRKDRFFDILFGFPGDRWAQAEQLLSVRVEFVGPSGPPNEAPPLG